MKKVIAIICLFVMIGCKENNLLKHSGREIKILSSCKLSPIADSLFMEYLKAFPTEPAYAIFVDKKAEGGQEYVLTIAPFNKIIGNVYESGAVNYFYVADSVPVFLYTGLEDFVTSDTLEFTNARKKPDDVPEKGEFKYYDAIQRKVDFTKSWSYVHLDTVSYVVKGNNHPFINTIIKPTVQFALPDSL